jgi:23S rRNA (guanosine2251-2'-O)-methyltransferase
MQIAAARRACHGSGTPALQEVKPVVTKPPYPKKPADSSRPPRRENRSGGPATGEPRLFKRARAEDSAPARPNHRSTGSSATLIYGFHAARAALVAGRRKFIAMHATEAAANKLALDITRAGLQPRIVTTDELSRRLGANAVHQGVLLEAGPIEPIDLSEIVDRSGIVLVLDQITDPHNVGAILRTAAAFGVDALVTTTRHAPDFTGVVAKAASGGLDHVPIAEVTNLARALEELGQMGYFRIGLDSEGPVSFEQVALTRPVALVLGAEDKGLRRLTRENCDALARLDMPGAIKSLNVSNACAVALTLTRLRLGGGLPPV